MGIHNFFSSEMFGSCGLASGNDRARGNQSPTTPRVNNEEKRVCRHVTLSLEGTMTIQLSSHVAINS